MALPVNIDSTYEDDATDASVKEHQQHHDTLHQLNNDVEGGAFLAADEPAGGDLAGTYPNPSIAPASVGDSHIDSSNPIGRDKIAVPEDIRMVGTVGNPVFNTGWSNFTGGGGTYAGAGFWYDPLTELVHLVGLVQASSPASALIFELPIGYRPLENKSVQVATFGIPTATGVTTASSVNIFSTGNVNAGASQNWTTFSLSGVAFRIG